MRSTTTYRPRPLSDLVPSLTKGIFGRKNLLFGKMMAEWADIAGTDIADKAIPLKLQFSKKDKQSQATLHLAVQSAFALELSYQTALLIERLNIFFGYPAIKNIKIIQNSELQARETGKKPFFRRPTTVQEDKQIDNLVTSIADDDLQNALKSLGKAVLSRQNTDK